MNPIIFSWNNIDLCALDITSNGIEWILDIGMLKIILCVIQQK